MRPARSLALPLALLLASCAAEEASAPPPERDPATEQALADPIMIDPDLASQNEGAAALTVPSDHSLPLPLATDEEIASARAEAGALVGGSEKLVPPPAPRALPAAGRDEFLTLEERVAALPGAARCAALARSAIWAARLPEAFPVYPRGATQAAAGADAANCKLRAVRFATAVSPEDVLAFYAARARQAGFAVDHAARGGEHGLSGRKGAAAFQLNLRRSDVVFVEVDLITTGF